MRILHTMLRVGDLAAVDRLLHRVLGMSSCARPTGPSRSTGSRSSATATRRSGAVLELTYNYDVPTLRDRHGLRPHRDRGRRRRRGLRGGARRRGGDRHARSGPGQGRHDGDRVRPGPRRLQDRADRATKALTSAEPAADVAAAPCRRADALGFCAAAARAGRARRRRRPGRARRTAAGGPRGSKMNVPAEWSTCSVSGVLPGCFW